MTAGAKRMFTAGAQQSRKASGLFAFSGVAGAVVIGAGITTVTAFAAESKPKVEFKEVKEAVKKILDEAGYDDGSIGPVLVRLAWHASGTYCATTKTGGSDGATMRFTPEAAHGANAGLAEARKRLEPIKAQFPGLSFSDLWIYASYIAIEEMGGPKIPFRPGRSDKPNGEWCTPDGRLPDADKGTKPATMSHMRDIFYRQGFNDQEIVALCGAHALGRCHTDRSGYSGPWTRAPTTFSNEYFRLLIETQWVPKQWKGPKQYENADGIVDQPLVTQPLTYFLHTKRRISFHQWGFKLLRMCGLHACIACINVR